MSADRSLVVTLRTCQRLRYVWGTSLVLEASRDPLPGCWKAPASCCYETVAQQHPAGYQSGLLILLAGCRLQEEAGGVERLGQECVRCSPKSSADHACTTSHHNIQRLGSSTPFSQLPGAIMSSWGASDAAPLQAA